RDTRPGHGRWDRRPCCHPVPCLPAGDAKGRAAVSASAAELAGVVDLTPRLVDELVWRAANDGERWLEQVGATGYCSHPIRLSGSVRHVDRQTGEIAVAYATGSEPDGTLLVACGNRRASVCPSCSATYKGDARQLVAAGLVGGKGMPAG